MKKIRFGIIGAGWRSEFFVRVAKYLPDVFEVAGVMARDPEKGRAYQERLGVPVVNSVEELAEIEMDYVILAVSKVAVLDYLKVCFSKGIPVLCETPPADIDDEMDEIWNLTKTMNGKIQVFEQYLLQPLYASWLKVIEDGKIGEVQNINISALHDYHAMSVMRRYLGVGYEPFSVYGSQHTFNVTKTKTRAGDFFDGEVVAWQRTRGTVEFESGKVGYYDFSPVQYHTYLRTRQLNVQGVRGEIDDLEIRYLDDENIPIKSSLNRIDMGVYNNSEWAHKGIMLDGKYLYKNPFQNARLNDDEVADATCMFKMYEYVTTGVDFYSLQDALQDTYVANLIKLAAQTPHQIIKSEKRVWMD